MKDENPLPAESVQFSSLGRMPFSPRAWAAGELLAEAMKVTRAQLPRLLVAVALPMMTVAGGSAVTRALADLPAVYIRNQRSTAYLGALVGAYAGGTLITWVVLGWLWVGVARYMLTIVRYEPIEPGVLSSGGDRAATMVFTSLMVAFLSMCASLAFGLPAIPVALGFGLHAWLVADTGLGPVQCLRASWAAARGHKLRMFGLSLLLALLNGIGLLPAGLGLLFTVPFTLVTTSLLYVRLTGRTDSAMGDPTVY